MPQHQTLAPEMIFAFAIWPMPIFLFVIMIIAALVSLLSEYITETESNSKTKLKLCSRGEKFTKSVSKRKTKIKRNPDIS